VATESLVRACRIGEATVLIAFPGETNTENLTIEMNGHEPVRVFTSNAAAGKLVVAQFGGTGLDAGAITLHQGGEPVAVSADQPLHAFISQLGLSLEQSAGVLFLLTGTITKLFRLHYDKVMSAALREVSRALPMPSVKMEILCVAGIPDCVIRFSQQARLSPVSNLMAFADGAGPPQRYELTSKGSRLVPPFRITHVVLPRPAAELTGILAVDQERVIWFNLVTDTSSSVTEFHDKHMQVAPEVVALFMRHAQPELRRDLVEVQSQGMAAKRAIVDAGSGFHFSAEVVEAFEDGVFIAGWYLDPHDQLLAAEVVDFSLRHAGLETRWTTYHGLAEVNGEATPVRGVCAWMERKLKGPFGVSPAISVTLKSRSRFVCRAGQSTGDARWQRDAIVSAIHLNALDAGALRNAYQPAMAAISKRLATSSPVRKIENYGVRSARHSSIVIPLYGELRFLRSQLFGFAADRELRETCEVIYVLDDPKLSGDAEQNVASLARVTNLDLRLVILSGNYGYGCGSNAGAEAAEGETLILMNSDVVPLGAGWFGAMSRCLSLLPDFSVVGPKLLYADGNLQHAGMYFFQLPNGVFQNMHYYKGYGRDYGPANVAREVPAVTGAVMALKRSSFLDSGSFTTDYVIGDYEDSDLCLKLRARGGICQYLPTAELYHFERQSIKTHPGSEDSGATSYNRHLHHSRWQHDIAALMQAEEFLNGANRF
jgi:GT2 family glycosyltransferase